MGQQHCVNKGEGYITSKTYQCYFRNVCVNVLQLLLDKGVDYDVVLQHNIDFHQLPVYQKHRGPEKRETSGNLVVGVFQLELGFYEEVF